MDKHAIANSNSVKETKKDYESEVIQSPAIEDLPDDDHLAIDHFYIHLVDRNEDADLLESWGLGAISLTDILQEESVLEDLVLFHGKKIIIIADNSPLGYDRAEKAAGSLFGTAKSVKIIFLPGVGNGDGGLVDWVVIPGNGKEKLVEMIKQTDEWCPAGIKDTYGVIPVTPVIITDPVIQGNQRFLVNASGIHFIDCRNGELTRTRLCDHIRIAAYVRDEEHYNWGKRIEFFDHDLHYHIMIIPMSWMVGNGSKLRRLLMDSGFGVPSDDELWQLLLHYLQCAEPENERRERIRTLIGWHKGAFVLPDMIIGTGAEDIFYQPLPASESAKFQQRGTLLQWQERVAKFCIGNSIMTLVVSLAFAPALLCPLNGENGGIHIYGKSSTGKTTALLLAASVFGGQDYMQRWLATASGLEGIAAAHNDTLLVLDELGQIDPKKAGDIAYMLGNGSGKIRANSHGATTLSHKWRIMYLSAGEITLSEHMRSSGKEVKDGQEIRLLNIPADAGLGMGIYENIYDYPSAAEFNDAIRNNTEQFHGVPYVAFLERITEDFANAKEFASNLKNNFLERYLPKGTKGQVCRVANRFALIAAAGELATLLGVTGWPVGEATEAAWKCFNTWLETKGCINGTTKAILDQVQAFFKKNGCRFQEISDKTRPKSDCAGFRAVESEGEIVFYVFPSVFRSEVCAGLDFNEVCRVLTENGVMEKGKDSHITKLKRIPALGKAVRCYHIIFKNWDNGA